MKRTALALGLGLQALAGGGCAMIRGGVARSLAPMAENLAASLQRQSDLELVRAGAPAYLLLLDGLAESPSSSPRLRLAAADAHTAYALAFLGPEDRERSRALFARARDYALEALCARNRRFRRALAGPMEEFEAALRSFKKRDAPALFTAGTAWANWILASSDSVEAVSQFGRAVAMMERVLELDPGHRQGGAHVFFGIYRAVRPLGTGRDLERSRAHFESAFALGGPDYLLSRVAFAESYARYAQDRAAFEAALRDALAPREDPPEFRLMNAVARVRARALLAQIEEYFP